MIARLAVPFVLLAVPAAGQTPVITNANVGKTGNIEQRRTVTEEELASLRAHQFVYVPGLPAGPEVIHVNGSTAEGPFGSFSMPGLRPLGTEHVVGGSGWWGHSIRGPVTVSVPNVSAPAPVTVPPFARGPATIAPVLTGPTGGRHGHRR